LCETAIECCNGVLAVGTRRIQRRCRDHSEDRFGRGVLRQELVPSMLRIDGRVALRQTTYWDDKRPV
jgi:hypothetical protein